MPQLYNHESDHRHETFDQFYSRVMEQFPNAIIGEDADGQVVIHTNMTVVKDDKVVMDMDERDRG